MEGRVGRKPGSQTTLDRQGLVGVKEVSAVGQSVEPIYPYCGKEEMEGDGDCHFTIGERAVTEVARALGCV